MYLGPRSRHHPRSHLIITSLLFTPAPPTNPPLDPENLKLKGKKERGRKLDRLQDIAGLPIYDPRQKKSKDGVYLYAPQRARHGASSVARRLCPAWLGEGRYKQPLWSSHVLLG